MPGAIEVGHAPRQFLALPAGALCCRGCEMDFKLERAEYDHGEQRAYVECRVPDDDGG
jgi:hypothetical protein